MNEVDLDPGRWKEALEQSLAREIKTMETAKSASITL